MNVEPTYNEAGNIFPKSGELANDDVKISYSYHGNGCTLIIDDVIIDYDLDIFDTSRIEITDWKFYRFIEGSSKGASNIKLDDLDSLFVELSLKGILIQKYADRYIFLINNEYFKE